MIQKKREKKTTNTELLNSDNKHLSIQFSLDGFSFCILNKDENVIAHLSEYTFKELNNTPQKLLENIRAVFKDESLLQKKYESVNVSHVSDLATMVPKSLFDENKLREYIKFNNKVFAFDYIVYDEIKNHELINVFIPYVNINNYFIDQFGEFEYRHYSGLLVENLLSIYKYSLVPHMFAHVHNGHFELVVIANKKLQLYNTFELTAKEDFIYYILFTAEQLKMNPEKFELILLGDITKDDELFKIAYTYVRNVKLLENRYKQTFDPVFTEDDKRRYFSIFNQF